MKLNEADRSPSSEPTRMRILFFGNCISHMKYQWSVPYDRMWTLIISWRDPTYVPWSKRRINGYSWGMDIHPPIGILFYHPRTGQFTQGKLDHGNLRKMRCLAKLPLKKKKKRNVSRGFVAVTRTQTRGQPEDFSGFLCNNDRSYGQSKAAQAHRTPSLSYALKQSSFHSKPIEPW